jgi:hypothetical protein
VRNIVLFADLSDTEPDGRLYPIDNLHTPASETASCAMAELKRKGLVREKKASAFTEVTRV